ncbi:hATC-domain-containing protein [Auricularia subglabra TFB-10046 SS5]|nr:hATC-domain-containing protein [Auricularia subglabra TFB-10046 SS5]
MLANPHYASVHAGLERGLANLRKWYRLTDETDIYFVCMILDPTIKLEYFIHEWDKEWIDAHRQRFDETVRPHPPASPSTHSSTSFFCFANQPLEQSSSNRGHYGAAAVARARQVRAERERANYKAVNEVERYLTAPLEMAEDDVNFDVVRWWGHHQSKYPVLALIARDYLAIQGSAVASERVFSGAAISVTKRWNRLSARMISALQRLKYAYRDGRLSAVEEAWLHLDETFDESAYKTDDD